MARPNIHEVTEIKKLRLLGPIKRLIQENNNLKTFLRSYDKRMNYRLNKMSKQLRRQGEYIECLKMQLREQKLIDLAK